MAWIGMVAGAAAAYMGQKDANKTAGKSGWTDITTTTSPTDTSSPYRDWAMQQAYGILNPQDPTPSWQKPYNNGDPANRQGVGSVSNGTPNPGNKDPQTVLMNGKTTIPKPPAGNGGKPPKPAKPGKPTGGSGQSPANGEGKWSGQSANTQAIINAAMQQAQNGNRLYGAAEDYIDDTMSGDPARDRNAYRTEAADALRNMDDPDLRRLKDMLFADVESARPKGGSTSARGEKVNMNTVMQAYASNPTYNAPASAGGIGGGYEGPPGSGPVGVVDDIRNLLAGQGAPQAVKDVIAKRNEEEWNKRIAEKMGMYVSGNQLGSSSWTSALNDVNTTSARELGDSLAVADYGLYQHGLDLGSQYDTAALDRDSRERMSAADRAQAAANASNAAASDSARLKAQMDLARLDALQNAVGMGQRQSEFKATGMGSLADLYGQDQRYALGATPDITGLGMRDWTAAGQLSLGSDQNRNQWDLGKRNADASSAAARASARSADQRLAFDRQRWEHDIPLMDLDRYVGIINGASGAYGTTRQFGQTPPSGQVINPGMAAIGGAAAGYSIGSSWQNTYGGGK